MSTVHRIHAHIAARGEVASTELLELGPGQSAVYAALRQLEADGHVLRVTPGVRGAPAVWRALTRPQSEDPGLGEALHAALGRHRGRWAALAGWPVAPLAAGNIDAPDHPHRNFTRRVAVTSTRALIADLLADIARLDAWVERCERAMEGRP